MAKTIEVQLSQLKFPPTCVVCMSPASKQYGISQVFSRGTGSATVHINVPMCTSHFEAASAMNSAEKIVVTCGVIVGILAGIATLIILIMVWALFAFWLAPMFAVRESKEARNAVRIVLVSPHAEILRLEFMNEQLAEIVQKENPLS